MFGGPIPHLIQHVAVAEDSVACCWLEVKITMARSSLNYFLGVNSSYVNIRG